MNIYLIRHAKAVKLEQSGVDTDAERPLSPRGERQARLLGRTLQKVGVRPEVVLTSPLVRARRTAVLLIDQYGDNRPELVVAERLAPGDCKPRKLMRLVESQGVNDVAVVAHQPDLSIWAEWLIGRKSASVAFAPGGVACIVWDDELKRGNGTLVWLITPQWYEETGIAEPIGESLQPA